MQELAAHNSKELFIDKRLHSIRPLMNTDAFSDQTTRQLSNNGDDLIIGHLTENQVPIAHYLSGKDGFVFVAIDEEKSSHNIQAPPVGFAAYVRDPLTLSHGMLISVSSPYRNSRLPLELAQSLISDAANHHVKTLYASCAHADRSTVEFAERLGMSSRQDSAKHGNLILSIQVDKHPGTVTF